MSQSRQNKGMARPKPSEDPSPFNVLEDSRDRESHHHVEPRRGSVAKLDQEEVSASSGTESDGSEGSVESHGQVEKAVMEDMVKFEDTFKGITQRFRLINRIGEGT